MSLYRVSFVSYSNGRDFYLNVCVGLCADAHDAVQMARRERGVTDDWRVWEVAPCK